MSYINIINNFWAKFRKKPLPSSAVAIFFYILDQCNREYWEMPVSCLTSVICAKLSINRSTFSRARKKLKERGLITYRNGKRSTNAPTYFILCDATSGATIDAPNDAIYNKDKTKSSTTTASMLMNEEDLQKKEDAWFSEIIKNEADKKVLAADFNISVEKINQLLEKFKADIDFTREKHPDSVSFRRHVKQWMIKQIKINNNNRKKEYGTANSTDSGASTYEKRRERVENLIKELSNRKDSGKQIW